MERRDQRRLDGNDGDGGSGRRSRAGGGSGRRRSGGFGNPQWGYNTDGDKITFSLGYGNKEGETLIADGWVDRSTFRNHGNHNHYGKGDGRNNNVRDRDRYTGPDA